MSKLLACLAIAALVGLTSVAFACDLKCELRDAAESSSESPCHPDGPHPGLPTHGVHARDAAKVLPLLPVGVGPVCVQTGRLELHKTQIASGTLPGAPSVGALVLRI